MSVSEYKRARAELKKRSTDTLRLQKKVRKGVTGGPGGGGGGGGAPGPGGGDLQRRVEASLMDVNERRQLLEEAEKRAVRAALVEERSRFCLLVAFLKPVVVRPTRTFLSPPFFAYHLDRYNIVNRIEYNKKGLSFLHSAISLSVYPIFETPRELKK